jgi:hypothetical protein
MDKTEERERKILSSWKDIAVYMGRGVRTVQRYEHLGLPVIRLNGHLQSSVMAFADEIDDWIRGTAMRSSAPIMPIGVAEWERLSALVQRLQTEIEELRKLAIAPLSKAEVRTQRLEPTKVLSASSHVG